MEDKIIIPMIAKEDIEESIPAMGIGCKKGEVFMYDPENQIHVNLKDNGVLADMPNDKCEQIKADLTEVQAAYDNHDSILVVPISTDYLRSMRVIGKALDVDVIMHSQNTLFF